MHFSILTELLRVPADDEPGAVLEGPRLHAGQVVPPHRAAVAEADLRGAVAARAEVDHLRVGEPVRDRIHF